MDDVGALLACTLQQQPCYFLADGEEAEHSHAASEEDVDVRQDTDEVLGELPVVAEELFEGVALHAEDGDVGAGLYSYGHVVVLAEDESGCDDVAFAQSADFYLLA